MSTTNFEALLARDGKLVYKTRGFSMEPMLRQNRDLVILEPPTGRLRPYDVALYRRGDSYVLHRVICVREQDYLIRGDNTYRMESGITDQDVIGVLTAFVRRGKEFSVNDRAYQFYSRVWCAVYPLRVFLVRCRQFSSRTEKKLRRKLISVIKPLFRSLQDRRRNRMEGEAKKP